MGSGIGETVVAQPGGIGGAEIALPAIGGGDDGLAQRHRLGQRQAEPLAARRAHQRIGAVIQRAQGGRIELGIDQRDRGTVRMPGAKRREIGLDPVMDVRECLDDEFNRVGAAEGVRPGGQQNVDPLARKA